MSAVFEDNGRKIALIVGLVAVALVGVFVLPAFGDSCGDWDRADAEDVLEGSTIEEGNDGVSYEHEPGEGDYRKTGPGEFEYVGCSDGSGTRTSGGSGGGSGFTSRGGGPGFGK
ncbi:hypothetical protein [Streptomonospora litoralis]|uniref:Uncharacterized protein n=1 Tax=Streptomonospora litoralis TaxID=2498135 RepID=A0A4P6PWS2_9ACTN|nr:hypothetical protein [Streptomonospora litoralis]QBI52555.1 hypothetical protein EKD16_03725 [Streptomonospora litoralis]